MGAFTRKRQIQSPDGLLRLACVYVWGDLSLRNTAAWSTQTQTAVLSDVALLERLQKAEAWLGWLLGQLLASQGAAPVLAALPYHVRLADATVVCEPGSKGTDWRVPLQMNLADQSIHLRELTHARGGETFTRYPIAKNELVLGDRGYGHRAGIAPVVEAGGQVLVRFVAQTLPLQNRDGTPFHLNAALSGSFAPGHIGEWEVQTAPDPKHSLPAVRWRLLALRLDEKAAQAARRRARQNAKKKGHGVQELTLLCGDFVLLFTTVPAEVAASETLLALYRFRWQIELGFKRLKSILHLGALPAPEPRLCRAWLYTKLLGALLTERIASSWTSFSPWERSLGFGSVRLASVADDLACVATGGGDRSVAVGMVGRPDALPTQILRPAA